jgi:hypothetical protein
VPVPRYPGDSQDQSATGLIASMPFSSVGAARDGSLASSLLYPDAKRSFLSRLSRRWSVLRQESGWREGHGSRSWRTSWSEPLFASRRESRIAGWDNQTIPAGSYPADRWFKSTSRYGCRQRLAVRAVVIRSAACPPRDRGTSRVRSAVPRLVRRHTADRYSGTPVCRHGAVWWDYSSIGGAAVWMRNVR